MIEIDFRVIEDKWQKKWEKEKVFLADDGSKKPKYYCLEMFPYPSGDGLHMGHAWNYTIGDILARFKRMNGFEVLHPMGFDALGLPAENAAIKDGTHPGDYTNKSIKNFVRQMKELGLSYDWTRQVNSASPDYYKWDQWIFLKMFEKGLAYKKESAVNWCPSCATVLANEQAQNGKCDRCETKVETKNLNQWFLKITNYADELYENLNNLDGWPERTKAMQKHWIGKSYGTEIDFEVESQIGNVVIVHGFCPDKESELKAKITQNLRGWRGRINEELNKRKISCDSLLMPKAWDPKYSEWKKEMDKVEINENSVLIAHSAGGAFAVRYLSESKKIIKKLILVSLGKSGYTDKKELFDLYGEGDYSNVKDFIKEGIILFTSEEDLGYHLQVAKLYEKEIGARIIKLGKGFGHFTSSQMKNPEFPELIDEILSKEKWPVFTTRPDTIFGVTFVVVSAQHKNLWNLVTAEQKVEVEEFLQKVKSVSEKDMKDLEKEGVFTGSYAVNPANGERVPIYAGNFVVADYGSGMVMAVPAHDKRDFEFAKKYGIDIKPVINPVDFELGDILNEAYVGKGILMNSGEFDLVDSEKAKKKITKWLEKKGVGRENLNFRLRDWGISRQRYWGTPIPIVYCEKCGVVPIPEKDLPVVLPRKVKFGEGNPLETNEDWIKVKCPKCGGEGRRETDTMDTFVNSSWYFMRYCDPNNSKKIFDPKKVKLWCPVDSYIGGAEHACMHLIYSRFYTNFLKDLGLIDFDEPVKKLFHQGMLHGEDGNKMSKSKGNGVLPEDVSNKYGIDTARFFLSSLASPDKDIDWSEKGIIGSLRFVKKIFDFSEGFKSVAARCTPDTQNFRTKDSEEVIIKLNNVVKNVTDYYGDFEYRKATIEIRELFDLIFENGCSKETFCDALKLLNPICPHITEELWNKLGNKDLISVSEWPKFDSKKLKIEKKEIDLNLKVIEMIMKMIKKLEEKGTVVKKIYLYVIPFELSKLDVKVLSKELGKKVEIYSVKDSKKYDPQGKAKKARPGFPGVWFE